jgi:hypothetical protein
MRAETGGCLAGVDDLIRRSASGRCAGIVEFLFVKARCFQSLAPLKPFSFPRDCRAKFSRFFKKGGEALQIWPARPYRCLETLYPTASYRFVFLGSQRADVSCIDDHDALHPHGLIAEIQGFGGQRPEKQRL